MQIDWQETTAFGTFGLVLSSFGAMLCASQQLRNERKYRQTANLERQLSSFLSEGFLLARRRVAKDRLMENGLKPLDPVAPPLSVFELLDYYEHAALLVKEDQLDVYDVWHSFYGWLQPVYADLRDILEKQDAL